MDEDVDTCRCAKSPKEEKSPSKGINKYTGMNGCGVCVCVCVCVTKSP